MNRGILFTLLICLLWQSQSIAGNSAGIVLYMSTNDEIHLLLADHKGSSKRGWSAFGGGAESGENRMETAARETEEETRGFFKKGELLKKLKGKKPFIEGKYFMYFLEIDFVSAQRVTNNKLPVGGKAYRERGPYAWIPYSELKKYLISKIRNQTYHIDKRFLPKGAKKDYFRKTWVSKMIGAYESKSIPWEN